MPKFLDITLPLGEGLVTYPGDPRFGVERVASHAGTHLDPPIYILEGLNLSGVAEGDYTLVCLPLRISGGDGGPARAILMEHE